ncbi:hypothetical protein NIES4071_18340 [Calothrix sp. NIES-4071]|nr:hypothetical protein NIES4071_18340 [Calothrix sp. NIES-4071]BAZ56167.1 hypothetical protein NIES4105_18290 [Calothrix sp. NIES-4105]
MYESCPMLLMVALYEARESCECSMIDCQSVTRKLVSMGYVDEANWIITSCDDYVQLLAINLSKWEDDDSRVFGSVSLAQQLATECGLEVIVE